MSSYDFLSPKPKKITLFNALNIREHSNPLSYVLSAAYWLYACLLAILYLLTLLTDGIRTTCLCAHKYTHIDANACKYVEMHANTHKYTQSQINIHKYTIHIDTHKYI